MLLTIHNLPAATRYADIKSLLQSKCGIQQVILDNLVSEGNSKKVTVGVAEDADATILMRKINGLFWNGQQLYVADVRQQKTASDQPYHSLNPQPEPQAELPYNSMNLANNSSYNMMAAQQMMTPMYYMPIPAYPNAEAYGGNIMDTAQSYRQEKVQSAYPGISGFAQNASAVPQYGASQFDSQQDYAQPAKRSRWEDDNQDSANEKSLYGRRYDQNRDWQAHRAPSPPRDQSRDSRKAAWQTDNDCPIQPDFGANVRPSQPDYGANVRPSQPDYGANVRPSQPDYGANVCPSQPDYGANVRPSQPDYGANVRPSQPDYRSNAGPTQPDFRPNVRPTEPKFRSTIRPEQRSDFVRPGLLDKPRREFGSNIQKRENERQGRSDEREIFSRRPYADKFSRRPKDEFSRRPNDEFSRRPNDEFSGRPNDEFSGRTNDEFSRHPSERAEFSRRPNVPDRSNERQGTSQFSGRPSGREEFSRGPNDREDRPKRPNDRAEFSKRPNVPNRSNERQGTNQFSGRSNEFSERQGKPNRFNQPNINRNNSGFDRNERPDIARQTPGHDQRPIHDSRKRKFEEFKPKSSQAFAPPKPPREQFASQPIAAPPLTEQAKEKLNKRMRMSGTNKILHDIYSCLNFQNPDPLTRRTFRQVVRERVDGLLGDKKMVTALEILETYRAKYPKFEDKATHGVVVERVAKIVAEQENGGNQAVKPVVKPEVKPAVKPVGKSVKPVVQPSPAGAPKQMAAPTRPPPPKPPTRGERRAMKNLKDAQQLLSQGKLPTFPLGDKRKVAQQRKEEKLGIIPETDPIMTAALTDEVDQLLQICTDELVNPPEETTRQIYKSVCPEEFIGDIKTIITQGLARRVTDSGLKVVRVYGRPKLPKREVLEKFLIKFGVQSLRKSDKVKMFTAAVDTYENFDKLCNATFNAPDGITVHFKPFHVAPKQRADQTLLRKLRKRNLKQMIDRSELNLLDKNWPAKEEEIKAREAEKQAKVAAEWAAYEELKALEGSQAVKTENVTEEPNDNNNTENVQAELTNITINEDDFKVDQTNATAKESNDYLHDDFHIIDEVNETDSDLECLGNTSNQIFYIDEDVENGDANDEGVNNDNDNTVENNDDNAVGDNVNDNNDVENVIIMEDRNNTIVEDSGNNGGEIDANNYDNINDDDLLDGDGDFEMDDADIDNVEVDFEGIDDGDLEDY